MLALIESKRDELAALCGRHQVRRLEVFGSGATETAFDPRRSDLDFLVEFKDLGPGQHADAYFGLLEGLQALFNRPVDLVIAKAIRNRYFLEAIQRSRTVLYAA
jgi:predicted nucleotidyltransferase